jgi:hypothetical protein
MASHRSGRGSRLARTATHCPKLANIDLARFTLDLDAYVVRITKMVDTIFSPVPALTG